MYSIETGTPSSANDTVAGLRVYFGPDQIGDDKKCDRKLGGLPRIPCCPSMYNTHTQSRPLSGDGIDVI